MAVLIFRLRGAPDDEANDIRQLLDDHRFEWYETSAGSWGISMPAIWLRYDEDKERAEELIKVYQAERYERVHGEYERQKQEGEHRKFMDIVKENPGQYVLYLLGILAVLYLSVYPFLKFFTKTE